MNHKYSLYEKLQLTLSIILKGHRKVDKTVGPKVICQFFFFLTVLRKLFYFFQKFSSKAESNMHSNLKKGHGN